MRLTIKFTNGDQEDVLCEKADVVKVVASWLGGKSKHVKVGEGAIHFDAHDGNKKVISILINK